TAAVATTAVLRTASAARIAVRFPLALVASVVFVAAASSAGGAFAASPVFVSGPAVIAGAMMIVAVVVVVWMPVPEAINPGFLALFLREAFSMVAGFITTISIAPEDGPRIGIDIRVRAARILITLVGRRGATAE